MTLRGVLQAHEERLLEGWFEKMLGAYPEQSRIYFAKVNSSFTNPVGANLHESLKLVLHSLISESPDAELINEHIQMILRIKAVQDTLPSQAVSFVPALKQVIEKECGKAIKDAKVPVEEILDFYSDIDTVGLYAFDSYSESRDLIYEMRLDQIRETNDILVRAQLVDQALDMKDFMQCSSSLDADCGEGGDCSACGKGCQVDIEKGVL